MKKLSFVMAAPVLIIALLVPFRKAAADDDGISVSFGLSGAVLGQIAIAPLPLPPPPPPPPPPKPPVVIIPAVTPVPAVIVEPVYPAMVFVAPSPTPVVVVEQQAPPPPPPPPVVKKTRPPFKRQIGLGFNLNLALFGHDGSEGKGMGGGGLTSRFRVAPHLALEFALDAYGGKGFDGEKRTEIPFSLALMFMPMHYLTRVQFYMLVGAGGAWAKVGEDPHADKPVYLGGLAGLGLEIKFGAKRNFALFFDLRGFIRKRVNDRTSDPLAPDGGSCKGEGPDRTCTDWEGGVTGQLGFVTYF